MSQMNLFSVTSSPESFSIEPGDFVKWGTREAIVMAKYEHCSGRVPMRVVFADNGQEGMPYEDEVKLVRKTVTSARPHIISDDCAARFAVYARS